MLRGSWPTSQRLEVVDDRDRRFVRPARVRLADAVDALVGLDLDEDEVAASDADQEAS